ncbi:MAG: sugar transferase [Gemmataceae bacterium]|nr:sugar transferase [Gemmataceae bacterium]
MPNALKTHGSTGSLRNSREAYGFTGLDEPHSSSWYEACKSAVERALALLMLVLSAPVIFVAAVLVKLTSPGPILYSQTRLGRFGRSYTIYKIRSMSHNCEKQSGPCWSTAGDTRVTVIGRLLRRTHVDELPQLWNVLRGDMSLIGPRPERPEFVPQLERALPHYRERLLVRPGVTGLAQVQLPPDTDLTSVRRKLAYDLYYVHGCNFCLDVQLLLATALHVVGVPYTWVGKLLFLPAAETIERSYRNLTTANGMAVPLDKAAATESANRVPVPMAAAV